MSNCITFAPHQADDTPLVPEGYRAASVTVSEARQALARMAAQSPEHERLAEVVSALLVRLDTIRDEAHFAASMARQRIDAGDLHGAGRSVDNVLQLVDCRGAHHLLLFGIAPASTTGRSA